MGRYDRFTGGASPSDADFSPDPAPQQAPADLRYSMDKLFPPPAPPAPPATPIHHGSILPFTTYSDKSVRFEPTESGLLSYPIQAAKSGGGLVKQALTTGAPPAMGEVLNAASLAVGLNPFVRSGDRVIPGVAGVRADMRQAATPASQRLLDTGGQQIEGVRGLPVRYNPPALGALADQAEQDLVKMGVFPGDSPQLYASLGRMRNAPPGAILEPGNLISIRKNLANLFTRPDEHKAGVGAVFDRFNSFIERPPAPAVLAGPAAQVGEQYWKGRANYAAGMRGTELADIRHSADLARASANSGQNFDNSLRQRVRRTVEDERAIRGYTPAEEQALEQIVLGAEGANVRRAAGNFLGGGGGLGAAVTGGLAGAGANFLGAGPAVAGLTSASVPLLGGYLKNRAAARTARALQDVEEATRRRSPLFLEQPGPDVAPDIAFGRDLVTRAVMQSQAAQARPTPEQQPAPEQQPPPTSEPLRITVRPSDRYDPENYL